MKRSTAVWLVFFIMIAGALLRSYHVTARSLWFDEAFSWRLVTFPIAELLVRDAADVHPPLFYVVLKGWTVVFGQSVAALRSFSITMAAFTMAALFLFTSYGWKSRKTGVLAAMLLAVSGWQIAFAWEARMYTMGTLLALLSCWALLHAVRQKQQRVWWWIGYAVLAAAFLYVHYFAFFSLAAQFVFLIGYLLVQTKGRVGELVQSRTAWFGAVSWGIIALFFAPWLPIFLRQNAQVQEQFWIPPIGGWSIPDTFYRMMAPTSGIPPHDGISAMWVIIPILFVFIALVWIIARCSIRSTRKTADYFNVCDAAWLTTLNVLVPFALTIFLSLVSRSLYNDRYFVFAHLFILTAVSVFVLGLKPAWLRFIAVSGAVIGSLVAFGSYWDELDILNKPGAHAATQYVFERANSDDLLLTGSSFIHFSVAHYASEEFSNTLTPKLYTDAEEIAHFAGGPIMTPQDYARLADLQNTKADTIWVVDTTGFGSSEIVLPADWQRQDHAVFKEVFAHQGDVLVNKYVRADVAQ